MRIVSHGQARRGAVIAGWLALFGVVIIVMLWAVELLSFRSHARVELQIADDVSAHAAATDFVTESVFAQAYRGDGSSFVPIDRGALILKAQADAQFIAGLSRVNGHPLTIASNPQNDPGGDIFAGTLNNPASRTFINLNNTGFDPYNPDLNAVRIRTRLPRIAASSTYFIDRDVIGFRLKQPAASSPGFPALPMVPIAILSEPCSPVPTTNNPVGQNTPAFWASKDLTSWEGAIQGRRGFDNYLIGPNGLPIPASSTSSKMGDGIPEITVTLTDGGNSGDNGQLLYFNPQNEGFGNLVTQVTGGLAYGDLSLTTLGQQPGQFILNDGTQALNQAPAATGPLPSASASLPNGGATTLAGTAATTNQPGTGLRGILGQPRIWVLYSGLANQNGTPTVNVVGFVVARVMNVQTASAGGSGNSLTITLQPSVLITDKALTNYTLRNLGPRSLYNPYIARLRFVE
jgi:hypothetical protein